MGEGWGGDVGGVISGQNRKQAGAELCQAQGKMFLDYNSIGEPAPPPAMYRVKWAQNCLNNQIVIEDTYSQSFRSLELQIRTIPGGVGWGVGKHWVIMLSQFN